MSRDIPKFEQFVKNKMLRTLLGRYIAQQRDNELRVEMLEEPEEAKKILKAYFQKQQQLAEECLKDINNNTG